jgi:flagellar protein FliS
MSAIAAYQEHRVVTQSRGRLVVLLYEGAIKFLRQAIAEIERKDWAAKGTFINKAVAILEELDVCLNADSGGEIATNLRQLYTFLRQHLTKAHARNDVAMIEEAIGILEDLNEGWKAITA